jgi:cytochrome c oxidase cbb3-type subunit 4
MISGIFTILAFVLFLGIGCWAYSRHNRGRFDEAAQLPLSEEHPSATICLLASETSADRDTVGQAPCRCKEPRS